MIIFSKMPSRNVIKKYKGNSYYHIYNRGVEKRVIFITKNDYEKFSRYMEEATKRYGIAVLNYALMRNHFHILIKQQKARDIEKLMRSLCTRYVLYFNFKYERIGSLFQGPYKARIIRGEEDLITISSYIEKHLEEGGETLGETLLEL